MYNPEIQTTSGTQDTRHKTKKQQKKTQHDITHKTKAMSNTDPTKNRG